MTGLDLCQYILSHPELIFKDIVTDGTLIFCKPVSEIRKEASITDASIKAALKMGVINGITVNEIQVVDDAKLQKWLTAMKQI